MRWNKKKKTKRETKHSTGEQYLLNITSKHIDSNWKKGISTPTETKKSQKQKSMNTDYFFSTLASKFNIKLKKNALLPAICRIIIVLWMIESASNWN